MICKVLSDIVTICYLSVLPLTKTFIFGVKIRKNRYHLCLFFNVIIAKIQVTFFRIKPAAKHNRNTIKFTITMLAPVGVENPYDTSRPIKKQTMEITADEMTTKRNCLKTRMADNAGKIIKLEISIVPIIRMPTTMVTAVNSAISIL